MCHRRTTKGKFIIIFVRTHTYNFGASRGRTHVTHVTRYLIITDNKLHPISQALIKHLKIVRNLTTIILHQVNRNL
jgi:hypothetical protein